jgi:large subunit ribosomal protein L21
MEKYAIVDVVGHQCKMLSEQVLRVPRLTAEVGSRVTFDKVLMVSDGKKIALGRPYLDGKTVEGEVVRHGREATVLVYKKKRRKNYRKKRGHRQGFTEILVRALPS